MGTRRRRKSGNLSCDCYLVMAFVPERASRPVGVVEDDGDGGFGDSGLALLVDEFLEVGSPNLLQIGDAKNEADGIENVRFSWTVQAGDGVEERVEARNHGARRVWLEPFQANLLDVHGEKGSQNETRNGGVRLKEDERVWREWKFWIGIIKMSSFGGFCFAFSGGVLKLRKGIANQRRENLGKFKMRLHLAILGFLNCWWW